MGTHVVMAQRFHVLLTTRQHALLGNEEANRTGLSIGETDPTRSSMPRTGRICGQRFAAVELSVGLWRRPDAAVAGRRGGRTLDAPEV